MKSRLFTFSLVIAILLLPSVSSIAGEPSNDKLIDRDEILSAFNQPGGKANIIVNLIKPSAVMTKQDWDNPGSLAVLHNEVHALQDSVMAGLVGNDFGLQYRYDNFTSFSGKVTQEGLNKLLSNPKVVSIEPVRIEEPFLDQGITLINGDTYRDTYDGSGVSIAIVDTGVDYTHAKLGNSTGRGDFPNSKVIGGFDFVGADKDNPAADGDPFPGGELTSPGSYIAHGTCCAGIAAGDKSTSGPGDYVGGVAHNAKLYALKVAGDNSSSILSSARLAAFDWCVTHKNDNSSNPILVISYSGGIGCYTSTCSSVSPATNEAVDNARAAGITLVAASGNEGLCNCVSFPACVSGVISVGAVYDASIGTVSSCIHEDSCTGSEDTSACPTSPYTFKFSDSTSADLVPSYSNTAYYLDLLAPAHDAYTTDVKGTYGYSSGDYDAYFGGTSASTPYAAGAVAALQDAAKSKNGVYLTPTNVWYYLVANGDSVTDAKPDPDIVTPRIDLKNAIDAIDTYCTAKSYWCDEYINRVRVGSIDNSTTCTNYGNYTAQSTTVERGVDHSLTVYGTSTDSSDYCDVWIDWNQDFDFEDEKEELTISGSPGLGPYTATITPPADALLGDTRMRIRLQHGLQRAYCDNTSYGEVEDYTVTVTETDCETVRPGSGTVGWGYPMHTSWHDSRTQSIYLDSEVGDDATIIGLGIDVTTLPGQIMYDWTIRLKHTSLSTYSTPSFEAKSSWTQVYQYDEDLSSTGWRIYRFDSFFDYDDAYNLMVDFSHNNGGYTTTGYCRAKDLTTTYTRSAYAYTDSGYGDPLDWSGTSSPTVYGSRYRPDIILFKCDHSFSPLCDTTVSSYPYTEDFESESTCGTSCGNKCETSGEWENIFLEDDIDWTVDTGGTTSSSTGPSQDHDPGTSVGKYLYTEATSCFDRQAILLGPCFKSLPSTNPELSFWYHMYGSDMGTLWAQVSEDSGHSWITVWSSNNFWDPDRGNQWFQARADLTGYSEPLKIRFMGFTGDGYRSDMAIDDIWVGQGSGFPSQQPTDIDLLEFTASRYDNEVLLKWKTSYEVDNLGFHVYRETDDGKIRITPTLLAGSALLAGSGTPLTTGMSYAWADVLPEKAGTVKY
ncbi:S8 family serine peptidase, partial [Acidobacteriota bacterium]